jgi:uncharacterized BrkB/YihY/UPF0761 family membrane protein
MTNLPMLLRRAVLVLVVTLPLLIVVYAVVMGGAALLGTLGDDTGALGLRWIGTLVAVLFTSAAIVLLLLLGWEHVARHDDEEL